MIEHSVVTKYLKIDGILVRASGTNTKRKRRFAYGTKCLKLIEMKHK
jgi:hypothetical protein